LIYVQDEHTQISTKTSWHPMRLQRKVAVTMSVLHEKTSKSWNIETSTYGGKI